MKDLDYKIQSTNGIFTVSIEAKSKKVYFNAHSKLHDIMKEDK
jgi:hypothetical protein